MNGYDPYEHAARIGIEVIHRSIRTSNGRWIPDHRLIVIRSGMRAVHDRSALAHELGHACLGHRDDRPKHERQADWFAARHCIDRDEAERVFRWAPDESAAALELGVSLRLLRAFGELAS
jgi:Zn-dependent peptidase ImmA (M78 family)